MSDFVGYKLRLYSGIINLAASAFLITGCSSDPITLPKSEQYNREFIKTFGVFDRTHDWNHATQVTVNVPDDFTMACTTKAEDGNMGGFRVEVHHHDGTVIISASNPNVEEQIGSAPQMICVPATWRWPREHVFIKSVYSGFADWCSDPDANNHWHETLDGSGYWQR